MSIFLKNKKDELFDKVRDKNGVFNKLLNNAGQPIGYFIRCELDDQPDKEDEVNVGISISFNLFYQLNSEKLDNHTFQELKFFKISDFKLFSISHLVNTKLKNLNEKSPAYYLKYDDETDYANFKLGACAIVNTYISEYSDVLSKYYNNAIGINDYSEKTCKAYGDVDTAKLAEYIVRKTLNTIKYYKNKKINLFFI